MLIDETKQEKANLVIEEDFEMVTSFEPEYIDGEVHSMFCGLHVFFSWRIVLHFTFTADNFLEHFTFVSKLLNHCGGIRVFRIRSIDDESIS